MTDIPRAALLSEVLDKLSVARQVLHSEADFQHHLAREMHLPKKPSQIRLEIRPDAKSRDRPACS